MKRSTTANVSVSKAFPNSTYLKSTHEQFRNENFNFSHNFSPVYYYSRLFGLMPFTIDGETGRGIQKPKVNISDGLWFLVSIAIYISMALIAYINMQLPPDANTAAFILVLGDYVLLIVGLIYSALIIIFDMYNRIRLTDILNKFITFDKEVKLCAIVTS